MQLACEAHKQTIDATVETTSQRVSKLITFTEFSFFFFHSLVIDCMPGHETLFTGVACVASCRTTFYRACKHPSSLHSLQMNSSSCAASTVSHFYCSLAAVKIAIADAEK